MYDHNEQLLIGLKNKELKAYEEIFFRYHGRLVLFARKFTGDLTVAQDIVQDAFLTLWEKSESITILDSPKAYLFQAVRNKALNYNRHLQVRQSVREDLISKIATAEKMIYSDFNDPFYSLLEQEMEQKIEILIDSMPEKCREVFKMSRHDHLKNKEIADKMGVSVKMIEKYISKALQILRTELSDYISILLLILLKNL
jgi:RNA polymerase sigma-70 factor (ECF subfamily)